MGGCKERGGCLTTCAGHGTIQVDCRPGGLVTLPPSSFLLTPALATLATILLCTSLFTSCVLSDGLPGRKHNYIGCICFSFPQCAFSNVDCDTQVDLIGHLRSSTCYTSTT